MQADAYRRARKLLSSSSPNAPMTAGFLGVVHSLLMLSLFGIAGLLVALLDTHGESRYPTSRMASFPKWMSQHPVAGTDIEFTLHRNTGLFPLVAGNLYSTEPNTTPADAGNGVWLRGDGRGHFTPVASLESGFLAPRDVAGLAPVKTPAGSAVLVANTADSLQAFTLRRP